MNKTIVAAVLTAVAAFGSACGEEEHPLFESEGGLVERPHRGKLVEIVNGQKTVGREVVESMASSLRGELQAPAVVVERKGTNAVWLILEESADAPRLLVAPEDGWARINVAALKADAPSAEKLEERFCKEVWRAYAHMMGAAACAYGPSVTDVATSLKELDEIDLSAPHPATQNAIVDGTAKFGVGLVRKVTYRRACHEGWAPKPTNDIQRAIWEKVQNGKADKADPTNRWKRDFEKK